MATISVHAVMLSCDDCGTRLRDGEQFSSATDARGAAYGDGWRFPPQLSKRTGQPLTSSTSDVCPNCLPGWKPQTLQGSGSRYERQQDRA
ncbi:hypothetical protein [Streptomyces luteocolor]|uniref:hypothetical protein n=1 Tax=Streptomyces luteocolor TaxID=285500 RepID=UPI0008537BBE|nr:hypothetical protein [Streptomyces luteocolor]